jgi:branched-chain amino acid transport system substrate-binding protein
MNKRNIILGILALVLIFGAYYFWKEKQDSGDKEVVKIGAVLPLSGQVASYGLDSKEGIDLAISLANQSQDKYTFVVHYQDSKGDPKTAVTALQQIISLHNPIAVIGENISSSTGAMIPIADKNKILLISPSASAPNLSGLSNYFFRVFPSDDSEGAFISETISAQHPNGNVAVIYVNNDYGVGLKNVFEKTSKTNNLNIVASEGFTPSNRDFKAVLAKIKGKSIDAIYIPSYYEDGAVLVKQIREQGIKAAIYGCTTHEDQKFLDIAGKAAEGFQYPISTGYNENDKANEVVLFITEFEKLKGKKPGLVTALGYDCASLIIDGVIKNGASTNSIRNYLLNTKDIIGAAGIMNFDIDGNVHKEIKLKLVKDGKFFSE